MSSDNAAFHPCLVNDCDQEGTHLYNIPYHGPAHVCREHFREVKAGLYIVGVEIGGIEGQSPKFVPVYKMPPEERECKQ